MKLHPAEAGMTLRRIAPWLLRMALGMALPLTVAAMEVEVSGPYVFLSGTVNGTEPRMLKIALEDNTGITTVVLKNSNGGDARTGFVMGEIIR